MIDHLVLEPYLIIKKEVAKQAISILRAKDGFKC